MKKNYKIPNQQRIRCFLWLFFLSCAATFAQILTEVEPNNTVTEAVANSQGRIYQPTIITGTVSSGDDDYWLIGYDFSLNFGGDERWWVYFDGKIPAGLSVERGIISNPTGIYTGTEPINLTAPFTDCGTFDYTSSLAGSYTYLRIRSTDGASRSYSIKIMERTPIVAACFGAVEPREEVVVPCTIPTAPVLAGITRKGESSLQLNSFPAVANADGYIIEITNNGSFSSIPTQYDTPISVTPNTVYSGSGNQVVANLSSPAAVSVSGLSVGSNYTFKITPYNHCLSLYQMGTPATTAATPTCGVIPSPPSSVVLSSATPGEIDIETISQASGGATGYITYVSDNISAFVAPTSFPTANTVYSGSGAQAVHVGTTLTPNENLTGFIAGSTYHFRTYSYEICNGVYYFDITGLDYTGQSCSGKPTTTPSHSVSPFENVGSHSMDIYTGFIRANANGYLLLMNTENSFTTPSDGIASIPTSTVYSGSGQQAVYFGPEPDGHNLRFNITGLTLGTTYYYKLIGYNGCGANTYFATSGLTLSQSTLGPVSTVASNASILEVGDTFMDFHSFTGAAGANGHVIKMNTTNSFTTPADGLATTPTASSTYGGGEQVIFAGSGTVPNFQIEGLSASTTYYFEIYSYSILGGLIYYNQTPYAFSQINSKPTPIITFNDSNRTYGDAVFFAGATSNSIGAFTYTLASQTNGGSAVASNGNITVGNVGTVTIEVNQAADANYNPGTVQATLTIDKADPILQFDSVTVSFGDPNQTLSAMAQVVGSGASASTGTITYSIEGIVPSGNSLSGANSETWSVGNAGTFTIRASIAEDTNYNGGFKDALFTVAAPAATYFMNNSGLFSNINGTASNILPLGGSLGTTAAGFNLINNQIWATTGQGGANNKGVLFKTNTDGTSPSVIASIPSSSNSRAGVSEPHEVGGKIWIVAGSGGASIGLGEIYSVNTDGTNFQTVHTFNGADLMIPTSDMIEFNGKLYGLCSFSASREGGIYSLTPDGAGGYTYAVEHSFTSNTDVKRKPYFGIKHNNLLWYTNEQDYLVAYNPVTKTFPHTISLGEFVWNPIEINNKLYVATSSSIKEVNASYTSVSTIHTFTSPNQNNGFITFDGDNIYGIANNGVTNTGSVYKLSPDGSNFETTYSASGSLTDRAINFVEKLDPVVTFSNQTVDYLSVNTLNATSNSTGAITYELIGDTTSSSLSGNEFTAGNVGTVIIRATVAGDANFNATTKDVTFTIQKVNPTFTIGDITLPFAAPEYTFSPSVNNYTGGTITYQFVDGTSLVTTGPNTGSTITADKLTVVNPGNETIRATLPANSNFNELTVDFQLTVNNATADLSGFVDFTAEIFQADITLSVPSAPGVAVSYELLTSNTGSSLSGTNNEILSVGNVVGTETIRVTVTESNYIATTKDVTLTISKATPVITWATPADIQFGIEALDTDRLNASANIAGTFGYWLDEADFGTEIAAGATTLPTIGIRTLVAQFFPDDTVNYKETTFSVTINVTKINLEITAEDKTWILGDTEPSLTYAITKGSVVVPHRIFIPLTRGTDNTVGTYPITIDMSQTGPWIDPFGGAPICAPGICIANGSGSSVVQGTYYNITFVPGTFTIVDKTPITSTDITFNAPASLVYDGTEKAYTATPNAVLSPALPAGDVDLTYEGRNGTVYTNSATAPINIGDYTVTATMNSSNVNYTGSLTTNFTIGSRPITVTVDSGKTKVYGDAEPTLTYQITSGSLIGSDTFTGSIARAVGEDVGNYAINQGTLALSSNYNLSFVSDNFEITQRAIEVTADAKSKIYGSVDPALTYQITSGNLIGSDAFTGVLTRVTGENVGNYLINQGTLTLNSNYGLTFIGANLSINQKVIGITANVVSKIYGESDPILAYQVTSGALEMGDAFTGSLERAAGENVGNYAINVGNVTAGANYIVNFTSNDLTIIPRPITVIAEIKSKNYGDPDPALTYGISSGNLVNSDVLSGSLTRNSGEDVGFYTINLGTINNANYDITFSSDNLHITTRPIEITADAKTKVFGTTDPGLTYQITSGSLVGSDVFTGSLARVVGENTGMYAINQGTVALNSNYAISFVTDNLEITKATATVVINNRTQTYDGTVKPVSVTTTPSGLAVDITYNGGATVPTNAGDYTVIATVNDTNYQGSVTETLTINKADQAITFGTLTAKTYGDSDFNLTATSDAGLTVSYTSSNTAVATVSGNTVTIVGAGATTITASQVGNANHNTAVNVLQALVIHRKDLEVTPNVTSVEYGFLIDQTGTVPVNVTGFVNGDDINILTPTGNTYRVDYLETGTLPRTRNVGTYANGTRIADGSGNPYGFHPNYRYVYPYAPLEIVQQEVTVTANTGQTKVYGDADPTLTYILSPLPVTDNALGLLYDFSSFALSGSLAKTAGENIGTYTINQGDLDATTTNYNITFVSDNFEITKRAIEVTADAKTKVYGEADPALTYQITDGSLVNSDAFTGSLTRVAGENVGAYAITQGSLSLTSNYDLSFVSTDLTIGSRAIEVTADAKTKDYSEADPALTYQITDGSLVNSDAFTGSLTRVAGENVGTYAINQGSLALNSNYAINYISNDLTITARPITVTADVKSKVYGASDPTLTYQITNGSLLGSDAFTGSLTRVAGENVGTYGINQGSLALNSNYVVSYIGNDLTITSRAITITADTKNKVYGTPDPVLTYQITSGSLLGSDTFTGSLDRSVGEDVGVYAINQGTLGINANYTISFVSNDLSITTRAITVASDAKNKVYGSGDPVLSYRITNGSLVVGDTFSGNLTRVVGENIGTYAINQGTLSLSPNYNLTYVGNDLSIRTRVITVTAEAKSKVYGASDPALTYQITSGSLVGSDTFIGSITRVPGETVGTYAITQGTLALNINYALTFINNVFSITAAANQSIWTGNTSSVWNVGTNWSGDVTPPTNHDVLIPNIATTPEIASGITAEMNNLTVEASSSVRIAEDAGAIVAGNFDNSGAVVITSTAATSGALIVKGTANGMVSYERGGLLANKWSIITAPVSGQIIKDFVDNVANNIRRNTTVTPNRIAVGYYDDSQPAGSKWVYYTTTDLASNSITFEKGRSYIISRATDGAVTFTGTIETNNVSKDVVASEWNAIGNPYTAYIPVNANGGDNFIQDNVANFDPTYMGVYVWDTTQNKYVANSLVTGAKSIVPGQGFFVRTTTGVTNMNFKESLRSVQNVGGAFNRGIEPTTSIELIVNSANRIVNTTITFRQEASLGLDPGYDLGNFDGANFDVFTRLVESDKKQNFAYQSLPEEALETQIIPIGIKSKAGANLIFTAENINLPEGISVYLEDKLLNKFIELDTAIGTSYTVQLDEKINGIGRFYLHTKSSTLIIPTFNINDLKIYNRNLELVVEGIQGKNFEMNVYNTVGAKVFEGSYEGTGTNLIDLPAMEVGVYIVRIITEFGIKEKKIIIKK